MADDGLAQYGAAVDEYLTRAYDGDRRRRLLAAGGWDPGFAAELAGLGWYALAVPEIQGGLGAPLPVLGPVFTQFGRHLAAGPLLETLLLTALLGTAAGPALDAAVETGVPPALADPGVTDDWAGDLGAVTLSGQRLSGSIEAVRFVRQARVLVVVADTAGGHAVCLVDPADPGVRIEDLGSVDPGSRFGRVVFDSARAKEVGGDDLVSRIRSWARLLIACELGGIAGRSLELTVLYLGQREQFGRQIGSFQAVKHLAADMHTRWAGLDSLCRAAVADAGGASLADLELLAVTAKAHAAEAAVRVCEDAIQLHGGIGFTTESDVGWNYRRALALRAWYGDETELQRRAGTALLAEP